MAITELEWSLKDLEKIEAERQLSSAIVEGVDANTGYRYGLVFVNDHSEGPYIRIDSEMREAFLHQGSEGEAQNALEDFAGEVRAKVGGQFWIHPFYGAIYGRSAGSLARDFNSTSLRQDLSMLIYLNNSVIGDADNPNRSYRGQAIGNGLGELWEDEYRKYNFPIEISPLKLTLTTLVEFLKYLRDRLHVDEVVIKNIFFGE